MKNMDSNIIMVSIVCNAYNHEKYIRDALEGFVMQKTNFAFEVLVHDDASTDHTADIIREYEKKYPDIIKPIYETENQYSKKDGSLSRIQYGRVKGKYIALCEGDDYWIDEFKLQKQVDYMENHSECTFCFTNAKVTGNRLGRVVPWVRNREKYYHNGDYDYQMDEILSIGFIPTVSFLFPTDQWNKRPKLSKGSFSGDTFVKTYMTSLGYAHFIDEDTCVYRFGVSDSVTTNWDKDINKQLAFWKSSIQLFSDMDCFTNGKYHNTFEYERIELELAILYKSGDYKSLRDSTYFKHELSKGPRYLAKYCLAVIAPNV